MSDAPPIEPTATPTAAAPAPVGPAVPSQSLEYTMPRQTGRPGVLTAVGVISILVAGLSGVVGLILTFYGFGFYAMFMAFSKMPAGAGPGWTSSPVTVVPGVAQPSPLGMGPAERAGVVRTFTRAHPLDPRRVEQLDAILAESGKMLGTEKIIESGTMPDSRDGEAGPEYFVTGRGRLELFNDRAVFFPSDGAPTIRVSAPGPVATPAHVHVHDAFVLAPGSTPGATTAPATAPTTDPAALSLTALTPAEMQSVIQQTMARAKAAGTPALNPQQVAALQTLLSAPGQQLVAPGATAGAVLACVVQPDGTATVVFSAGSNLTLGAAGNVVSQVNPRAFAAGFSLNPWSIALMIAMSVLSVGLAVFLLVAGIFVLRHSPRGRRLHLIYVGLKIPASLVGGFAFGFFIYEMTKAMTANMPTGGAAAAAGITRTVFTAGAVAAGLGCVYPVALLVALNVKSVREYYHSVAAAEW